MLVLRLVRVGRRNQPKFRLVAAEQGKKVKGAVVEILGHYEPAALAKPFVFDKEKVQGWLAKGGVPSNTVAKLLNMNGFDLPVHIWPEREPRKKVKAAAPATAPAAKEAAPAAEAVSSEEAPAEVPAEVSVAEPAVEPVNGSTEENNS